MNAAELAQRMAAESASIVAHLLPSGKRQAGEWKCGSKNGEPGQSLSVRLSGAKAGIWSDFSTGEKGDILDLWTAVRGVSMTQAMVEAKQFLGVRDSMPEREKKAFKRPPKPQCSVAKAGALEWLKSRGLTDKTIADFKIAEQVRDGKTYAVFPYMRDAVLINYKLRNVSEKKDMQQAGGAEPCLFGWHLIDPKARSIAITEGEIDAMSLHQCGIPAMSVNAGAGNHQWIENDWEKLERFSEILVFFDNDEAGNKGAAEIIHRLGAERCKRVQLPTKDANEWLTQGAESGDFQTAILESKPQDPDEMKMAGEFMNRLLSMFYPAADADKHPKLMLDVTFDWFDFRPGELTVWTGYNGHGKSLLLSQVQLGLMAQGQRFIVFSGEMQPEYLLKRLVKQATGLDRPTPAYIGEVFNWLNDRFWIFNQVGSATMKRLIEVFAYANKRYGVCHVVIDSLMMTDVPEDGPGAMTLQKEAIRNLCDFAKKSGVHIHLVAHPRKGKDESAGPGKSDVAGSSKITDGADNVFVVWRAQKDQAEPSSGDQEAHDKWLALQDAPDAKLILKKQRNGDNQDYTQCLWFDKESMQYRSQKRNYKDTKYVNFSGAPAYS